MVGRWRKWNTITADYIGMKCGHRESIYADSRRTGIAGKKRRAQTNAPYQPICGKHDNSQKTLNYKDASNVFGDYEMLRRK